MSGKMLLEGADVDKADNLNDDGDEHEDNAATRDKNTDTVDGRIEGGEAASGAQGTINGEPNITGRGTSTSNNDNNLSDLAAPNLNSMGNITQPNNANDVNEGDRVNKENKENSTGNATNSSSSSSSSSEEDSDKSDGDENEEMETDDSENEASLPPEEDEDTTFQLMDAVLYAESVSDTSLHHDVRNVLQYYCVNPKNLPVATIVDLFKVADLQERDPSMFGFLFVLLLCKGNQVWKQDLFTRMDRMAFFSAQSYLTPLPDSLKTFVVVPLFKKPISSRSFATIFSETTTDKDCIEKCFVQAFTHWQEIFDEAYYTSISNKDTLAPIKALVSIPCRRLDLAQKLSTSECEHECHWKLLSQVDRDTQGLYARLAEYYQGIE
ncbi:hypothetical protein BN14_07539 [Rhizoctonia solani AG-1 IB]|uniref:Uncharacterized protein n=1 Tax=Thanatephorus cucumeris (strain AG1-IB / isolate 7/3/14) TaxID=1108050 RepID=M5C206_THACB|nr:hypothetical protein BN14_07539 [Rhizoctonia solani AG-1 IB]